MIQIQFVHYFVIILLHRAQEIIVAKGSAIISISIGVEERPLYFFVLAQLSRD